LAALLLVLFFRWRKKSTKKRHIQIQRTDKLQFEEPSHRGKWSGLRDPSPIESRAAGTNPNSPVSRTIIAPNPHQTLDNRQERFYNKGSDIWKGR
jgi:hypothetical protein